MKEKIIVIRKWTEPEVRTYMDAGGVGIEMEIDKYLSALVTQITYLPMTFTKATLLAKLQEAHTNVAAEMRQTTKHVT